MKQPPILMYHWFRQFSVPTESRSPQLEIDPGLFARQMRRLAKGGWRTVSLARALTGDLPAKSLVITFDDGTADFWDHARPALAEVGFTATLFVFDLFIPDFIPFIDEMLLALLTVMLGMWQQKTAPAPGGDPTNPVVKDVTPRPPEPLD